MVIHSCPRCHPSTHLFVLSVDLFISDGLVLGGDSLYGEIGRNETALEGTWKQEYMLVECNNG
ncbi:hypothetical protein E2562_003823 [Oryza meyeriana var. granulata]|uniref:Uncharacterized protein n=1 Tax=Oryza meyeriana var. granulata TaxID=110450 RepID=A0A6G1BSB3_9ORYZ|nr:hypothetical protein E2562_003823 [Oryza meyeriana var. granulata]